jgi:drug/metabolite transporter (DMT)-like permease
MFNSIILIIIGTFFTSIGQILLKKSSTTIVRSIKVNLTNYILLLGVGVYFISMLFNIYALKGAELTVLVPITSLSYVWTILLSLFIFKESMNKYKWVGLFVVLFGIVIITTAV